MLLVTGANGQLGQKVVQHLLARQPEAGGQALAVSVRDPAKAAALADKGILVRQGSFDAPDALAATFDGVERLVLISTDGPKAVRIVQHRNAIAAARRAGVRHVLYTSFLDADANSPSEFAQVHADTEAALADSGLSHTVLRNPFYADFLPMTLAGALHSGVLALPAGDGRVSYASRAELGEAIAAAALAPRLDQRIYELSGQTSHDYSDLAARVSRVTGKPIRYEHITEDDYASALESHGVPQWFARALANMYTAAAEGRFASCSHDMAGLLGHAPRSLDCLVAEFFAGV